jgi:hypothetical protein
MGDRGEGHRAKESALANDGSSIRCLNELPSSIGGLSRLGETNRSSQHRDQSDNDESYGKIADRSLVAACSVQPRADGEEQVADPASNAKRNLIRDLNGVHFLRFAFSANIVLRWHL